MYTISSWRGGGWWGRNLNICILALRFHILCSYHTKSLLWNNLHPKYWHLLLRWGKGLITGEHSQKIKPLNLRPVQQWSLSECFFPSPSNLYNNFPNYTHNTFIPRNHFSEAPHSQSWPNVFWQIQANQLQSF